MDITLTSWAFQKALIDLSNEPCELELAMQEKEGSTIQ